MFIWWVVCWIAVNVYSVENDPVWHSCSNCLSGWIRWCACSMENDSSTVFQAECLSSGKWHCLFNRLSTESDGMSVQFRLNWICWCVYSVENDSFRHIIVELNLLVCLFSGKWHCLTHYCWIRICWCVYSVENDSVRHIIVELNLLVCLLDGEWLCSNLAISGARSLE